MSNPSEQLSDQIIIETLYAYGHFFSPTVKHYDVVRSDLPKLTLSDPAVKAALHSYQDLMQRDLYWLSLKHHGRGGVEVPGSDLGPATKELLVTPRCEVPDYFAVGDPRGATGLGSWPMPCQKEGIKVHIDKTGMPSAIVSQWPTIQKQVFNAYALMGGKLVEVQTKEEANIQVFFGSFFGSTIGVSEFNSQSCADVVTCKLSNSYVGYNNGLLKHEMGHNFNLQHTRGGTMNPSILPEIDSEAKWVPSDPSYKTLVKFLGGEPIDDVPPDFPPAPPGPIPTPTPTPTPTPNPVPVPSPTPFWDWLRKWLGF